LGWKKNKELSETQVIPSTPNLGIVNIYPREYTPLTVIPGNSTFSSQILSFEGVVVVVGDWYYDDRTKSIERRSNKIKRGDSFKPISSTRRIVEWKAWPNHEENAIQISLCTSCICRFECLIFP